jgi:hypothetical protein
VPELIVYHHPSPQRDSRRRYGQEIRNALWFAWLRRPWTSVLRRTICLARSALRDWPSCTAFAGAVAGLPWLLRERRVVPAAIERGLCLLERDCRAGVSPLDVGQPTWRRPRVTDSEKDRSYAQPSRHSRDQLTAAHGLSHL